MGLLDKLRERWTGRRPGSGRHGTAGYVPGGQGPGGYPQPAAGRDPDEVAVERYRYLLRTAPPETIEQAHREAFEALTPQQRQRVLAELSTAVPPGERARTSEPADLARMATRAELRQPGLLERTLGPGGGYRGGYGGGYGSRGPGLGMIGGSLLAGVAGAFIGTAVAEELFDDDGFGDAGFDGAGSEGAVADDGGFLDNDGPFGPDGGAEAFGGDVGGDFGDDFGDV